LIAGVSPARFPAILELAGRLGVADSIQLLPYVSAEEMQDLYRTAACMVFPSLIEGFGIPVLEAMASGCPVIVSDRGALPEVAGDAALVVDPLSVEAIAGAMVRIWSEPALAEELAAKGRRNAERFHPHAVHSQMREAWTTLLTCVRGRR
jgi:glycosyltransferase involved in cell wall biosynthesis